MDNGGGNGGEGVAALLPRSDFDLSRLPGREAAALWYESCSVLFDAKLHNAPEERLPIRGTSFVMDELVLGHMDIVPMTGTRSRARIGRDGQDMYSLHFCMDGTWRTGRDERVGPGDLGVQDHAQPYAVRLDSRRDLHLIIPRRLIAPLLKDADAHAMRVCPGQVPLTALLRSHIAALYKAAPHMTPAEARAVASPTLYLIAATLNGRVDEQNVTGVQTALVAEIRRYIDAHLLAPDLTPETIALAFGMSPRKLYSLFEPHGGVMAYVQRQRIARVRAILTDPGQSHRTIQDIAEEHGFTHRKSFIRAFRRQFGMTAREARAFAFEGRAKAQGGSRADGEIWNWICAMR